MIQPILAMVPSRSMPLQLVIYDCDGVLVDSEPVASRVCAREISDLGWNMTADECHAQFLGMSLSDMQPIVEGRLGKKLAPDWAAYLADCLVQALRQEAVLMEGAEATLRATTALGLDWRIASNSGPEELAAKFARTGLSELVKGRVHSAHDVIAQGGRGKPSPDLFLAAAAASGIRPAACVVVEDSVLGIRAAKAAGMNCIAFTPNGSNPELAAFDVVSIQSLHHLPGLFGAMI